MARTLPRLSTLPATPIKDLVGTTLGVDVVKAICYDRFSRRPWRMGDCMCQAEGRCTGHHWRHLAAD